MTRARLLLVLRLEVLSRPCAKPAPGEALRRLNARQLRRVDRISEPAASHANARFRHELLDGLTHASAALRHRRLVSTARVALLIGVLRRVHGPL